MKLEVEGRTVSEPRANDQRPRVTNIDYHRNGISGDGFFVAMILTEEDGYLTAIVPGWAVESAHAAIECPGGAYPCYVLDSKKAADGDIAFGSNSWRGDHYFDIVVAAAKRWRSSP